MNGMVSCLFLEECPAPSLYFLKDVKTTAFEIYTSTVNSDTVREKIFVDTFKHQLTFDVELFVEFAENISKRSWHYDFINMAYGCVDAELQNPIVPEKSSFSVNKPINLKMDNSATAICIEAETNLLTDERIAPFIQFPTILEIDQEMVIELELQPEFIFEKGMYDFSFRWETSDGTVLEDTISVVLDFD